MMSLRWFVLGWSVVALLAPVASAQSELPARQAPLGSRSWDYARALAREVGLGEARVEELDSGWSSRLERTRPDQAARSIPDAGRVRGCRAWWGQLSVQRLRFESQAQARRYFGDPDTASVAPPFLAEIRRDQIVIARGAAVADPQWASRLRAAAWGGGLPAPPAGTGGLVWCGSETELLLVVHPGEPGYEKLARNHQMALDRRGQPGYQDVSEELARLALPQGSHVEMGRTPEGVRWMLLSRSAAGLDRQRPLLAEVLAGASAGSSGEPCREPAPESRQRHAPLLPPSPTVGTAGVLEGAFQGRR